MVDHVSNGLLGILEEIGPMCSSNEVTSLISDGQFLASGCDESQFRDVCAFQNAEAQGNCHRGFDACSIHFAISLCRMAIAAGKQGTWNKYWEHHPRARR